MGKTIYYTKVKVRFPRNTYTVQGVLLNPCNEHYTRQFIGNLAIQDALQHLIMEENIPETDFSEALITVHLRERTVGIMRTVNVMTSKNIKVKRINFQ